MNDKKFIHPVVSSLLIDGKKILLLKRSQEVASFQGYWSCISGYVENGEFPQDAAVREIEEETNLPSSDFQLHQKSGPHFSESETIIFKSFWYSFRANKNHSPVKIDWEHEEFIWLHPKEVENYRTVPWLPKMIESLLEEKK